jgi:putative ABC transport system permease protein
LRKVLVVLQIGITVVLLAGIMNINQQLTFIQNKKLGFSKEQVLVLYARGTAVAANERYDSFKQRLLQQPDISGVTRNSHLIGTGLPIRAIFANPNAENSEKEIISSVFASYDFAAVHNLEFVDGRDFSKEFSSDVNGRPYILNQSAVKLLELEDPVGREISTGDRNRFDGEIVGVVKDFHFASLHEEISPLVINFVDAPFLPYICIKLGSSDYATAISRIEALWKQFEPDRHMEYYFLDDQLNQQYRFETQLGSIISYFTILAILIACLGLFGMASFTTERRTKEIGVRKTLGASVPGLVMLLSKDFARLVAVAFLMAAPIAYFVIDAWLQNFAYRTEIGARTFIFTGILALLIALGTVSYQTIKAAIANPVKALRYE